MNTVLPTRDFTGSVTTVSALWSNTISKLYGKKFNGKEITGSLTFADYLLENGVALIPGIAFGDDNSVRLSYCISLEDIKEGVDRIKKFISEVK